MDEREPSVSVTDVNLEFVAVNLEQAREMEEGVLIEKDKLEVPRAEDTDHITSDGKLFHWSIRLLDYEPNLLKSARGQFGYIGQEVDI